MISRTSRTSRTSNAPAGTWPIALAVDVVCVLLFCAVGHRSHAEGLTLAGVAETAWPFLTGTAVGWLLCRGWRRPVSPVPTGVTAWIATIVVGILLRKATGQGVAASFVVVATSVTALLLLGWRLAALSRLPAAARRP